MTPRSDRKEIEISPEVIRRLLDHTKRCGWTMELLMDHIMSPLREPYSLDPPTRRQVVHQREIDDASVMLDHRLFVQCPCCDGKCQHVFRWRGIVRCGCAEHSQGIADGKYAKAKLDRGSPKPQPVDRRYRP